MVTDQLHLIIIVTIFAGQQLIQNLIAMETNTNVILPDCFYWRLGKQAKIISVERHYKGREDVYSTAHNGCPLLSASGTNQEDRSCNLQLAITTSNPCYVWVSCHKSICRPRLPSVSSFCWSRCGFRIWYQYSRPNLNYSERTRLREPNLGPLLNVDNHMLTLNSRTQKGS